MTPASTAACSSFDLQHPPDPQLLDACVHCGFCLSTCPSYRVLGSEMDSPRGRIYTMAALHQGEIPLSPAVAQHFDSCLGCLACVTTCPSGVRYDRLIAATRPQVERQHQRPVVERLYRQLIFSLFPYPDRLRILLWPLLLYQKLGLQELVRRGGWLKQVSPHLAAMEANLPPLKAADLVAMVPEVVPAQGQRRYRVGMILGCVQRLFFDRVNQATLRVLTANGCEVIVPASQGCCGALPEHQGQTEQAQDLVRQMIDSFPNLQDLDAIIINAAGCGHTLKEYGQILADDRQYAERAQTFAAKVRDVQEFLAAIDWVAPLQPVTEGELVVVYQDACHLLHGQKISAQPRQLLQKIPGLQLREPIDGGLCCGSAGIYNMLQPEVAQELGQQKVQNLLGTGARVIASANPGCSLQISQHLRQRGQEVPLYHPIELLDRSLRGEKLAIH
jgi:glycolate oxidase iron-sulfur subunit